VGLRPRHEHNSAFTAWACLSRERQRRLARAISAWNRHASSKPAGAQGLGYEVDKNTCLHFFMRPRPWAIVSADSER
jgi:hypothetical protein